MRWSRLYLVLSIASLAVGVGMANCKKHDCRERIECTAPGTSHRVVTPLAPLNAAYDALRARDFADMAAQADLLIAHKEADIGHALRAYAVRGQGRHEEAIIQYGTTMLLLGGAEGSDNIPLLADCYIGRASCYKALGETDRALEDIEAAKLLVGEQLKYRRDDSAHYQLACVYATESELQEDMQAARTRGKAIAQLRVAIAKGFNDWAHMRADLDLDPLREDPGFNALFPRN
ncbi:MAG: hypothetical protein H6839_13770 [Planctomycetes bacterium]|nr:hypothetical protein [Planctomycetota bacterium]